MAFDAASSSGKLIAALRGQLQGRIVEPDDADYREACRVWNGAIDRRPSAIAVCADAEDVALALRIATDHGSELTVRGGGHNVAGRSIRDGALLIDLSRLREIAVNRGAKIAKVQGGALWADVDEKAGAHGLATTGGLISTTGVGGYTLGGGVGWLMRRCGLACDNLVGATVVLADGRAIRASESEHPDLFWALRGSACGLGVVSSFDFRLHEVAEVVGGLLIHPGAEAETVLRRFRDFAAGAPDEFCGLAVLTSAPPFPFLDAAWHGKPAVILALCWCGQPERGEQALAPLVQSPDVLGAHVGRMPYARWQKMLDPAAPPGRFNYWKTLNFSSLGDAEIGQLADAVLSLPTPVTEIHVQHLGGTVARAAPASTAFASREARFFVNLIGVALDADAFAAAREGVRALYSRLTPAAMASVMPNFTDRDDGAAAENTGSALAERLRRVRNRYDPTGVFAPR